MLLKLKLYQTGGGYDDMCLINIFNIRNYDK